MINYVYEKRNGNGQSVCHLCNRLTWDCFCYNFRLYVIGTLLCNTVLCDDCIQEIKNIEYVKEHPDERN